MSSTVSVNATVIGWLKEDAAMKEISGGFSVCNFAVKALKYNRKTKEKDTIWFNCSLWGKKGERMRPMLREGKYVMVQGSIDSFKHVNLNVSDITLLSQKKDGEKPSQKAPPPPPPSVDTMEDVF